MKISEIIEEGIHDPAIFKAVFLVGGPGSGKSYIEQKLGLSALGFVSIDSDALLSMLMGKEGLSLKMPPEEEKRRDIVRGRAKQLTRTKRDLGIDGRLGLVVQGTGGDYTKIATLRNQLNALGYDTFIVAVNTNLETAKARNLRRDRSVPDDIVVQKWQQAQQNIGKFLNLFTQSAVIDNNGEGAETEPQIQTVYKRIMNWSKQPPTLPAAKQWMASQQSGAVKSADQKWSSSLDKYTGLDHPVNEEPDDRHTFSNYRDWKNYIEGLTPVAKKKPSFVFGADSAAAFIGDTHIGRFDKNSGYVLKDIPQKRIRKPKSE